MNYEPEIVLSIIAIVISGISFIIAIHNSHVDRRIQYEQIKSDMVSMLTMRSFRLMAQVSTLSEKEVIENKGTIDATLSLVNCIINLREQLKRMQKLPLFGSIIIPEVEAIRNDLKDAEILMDEFSKVLEKRNFVYAEELAVKLKKLLCE